MSKDPYKYFRVEARELVETLSRGVLQLEQAATPDAIPGLLRAAHTLKGAARVVKQPRIADLAHGIEEVLTGHRGSAEPLPKATAGALLHAFDEIGDQLSALDAPASAPRVGATHEHEPLDSVRIDRQDIDSLLQLLTETRIHVGTAGRRVFAAERLRDVALQLLAALQRLPTGPSTAGRDLEQAVALAAQLHGGLEQLVTGWTVDSEAVTRAFSAVEQFAHQLHMLPAATIFPTLERAVRDAAASLGRDVEFRAEGGDVELDAQVLASVRAALMHVVRNAVAHGIEPAAERRAAGKAARGSIRLCVLRRGGRVAFRCQDDGRGVDIEAVRDAAVKQGALNAEAAPSLSSEAVLALLGAAGLSTSTAISAISGRGIGLDVARTTAASLNGEFQLRSAAGRGLTVDIEVPLQIASITALLVEYSEGVAAVPLDAAEHAMRVRDSEIKCSPEGPCVPFGDALIPFLPLDAALGVPATTRLADATWQVVVLRSGGQHVALGVNGLLGAANVTLRSLPALVQADPVVAGASLDDAGAPRLILDPHGLVQAARQRRDGARPAPPPPPAPVLIIDDSLTTRMLEQSILESAGYVVELAASAEEGLAKAKQREFSLFLVDVEMPGMNGFEFVDSVRRDPALRSTPAILVTSRNSPQDLMRGEQVGADAYIVKGEFDQRTLLTTIRALVKGT